MSGGVTGIAAPGRVLPTMNEDGSRRWVRPKPSAGRWMRARRIAAYALMVLFFAIPYLTIAGRPVLLLDLPRREFTLFGTMFQQTETLLFMLLFVSAVLAVFFFTALFGRVWCGWACPQTVYMEFLFRPVERLVEGGWRASQRMDRRHGVHARRLLKHAIYLVLALFLAHTFLAYFVRPAELAGWMTRSPVEHPMSFFIVMLTTAMIFLDFAWFREQTCLLACPYGRLQAVLLDRRSVIVGYDGRRGEPRTAGIAGWAAGSGDCVSCNACVVTCPTGIDIRDGLQMECIGCTQCMDACDAVMARFGREPGLIRYASRDALEGRPSRLLRGRVVVYPVVLAAALGALAYGVITRPAAEVMMLRDTGTPFVVQPDGRVSNPLRLRIGHRGARAGAYHVALVGAPDAQLVAPLDPLVVEPGRIGTAPLFVLAPASSFHDGGRDMTFRVTSAGGYRYDVHYHLVGPDADDDDEHAGDTHEPEGDHR